MSEINWNDAPEGAERYHDRYDCFFRKSDDGIEFYSPTREWIKIIKKNEPTAEKDWNNATPRPDTPKQPSDIDDGKKYEHTLIGLCGTPVQTDVYRVLDAFATGDPILDHLIKKALCAGKRGHKDKLTDYRNIVESATKALQLLEQKS